MAERPIKKSDRDAAKQAEGGAERRRKFGCAEARYA